MDLDEALDRILVPRPNGSAALDDVARFLADNLERQGADVALHAFPGTPHGFELVWTVALLVMLGWALALAARRHGLALALALAVPVLLLLEFEGLRSPVSGWWPATQVHVEGRFPGRPDLPRLVLTAHYDTTTHFGDHFTWAAWGVALGPAVAGAVGLAVLGLFRGRLSRWARAAGTLCLLPFAALAWCQAAGPWLRAPSPGALDNGGSVAVLLQVGELLASRRGEGGPPVSLLFLAAEEERALGSWILARRLDPTEPLAVVNLETVGTSDALVLAVEDGFFLRRFASPPELAALLDEAAREIGEPPLPRVELPRGVLTDGRSFLARGIPTLTLAGLTADGFPRGLHSARDSRERLSRRGLERAVALLSALVDRLDARPDRLATVARRPRA